MRAFRYRWPFLSPEFATHSEKVIGQGVWGFIQIRKFISKLTYLAKFLQISRDKVNLYCLSPRSLPIREQGSVGHW